MTKTDPTYRCGEHDVELEFQGLFGTEQFRRYRCPVDGTSYPESAIRGRFGFDPSAELDFRTEATGGTTALRNVFVGDKFIGRIEYVSRRVKAPSGSPSDTGFHTHWGWRPLGSRIRNLGNISEAAQRLYERNAA